MQSHLLGIPTANNNPFLTPDLEDGVLVRHPPPQRAFHLRAERELAHLVALALRHDEALLTQGLVLESLQAVGQRGDLAQAGCFEVRCGGRGGGGGGGVGGGVERMRVCGGGGGV